MHRNRTIRFEIITSHPTAVASERFIVAACCKANAFVVAHDRLRERHGPDHFHSVSQINRPA